MATSKDFNSMTITETRPAIRKLYDLGIDGLTKNIDNTSHVYLACPWFKEKDKLVMDLVHDFMICKFKYGYYPYYDTQDYTPAEAYAENIKELKYCTELVAIISTFDTGTAYEIGYAKALDKKITLIGYNELTFNHGTNIMLAFAADRCYTLENYLRMLKGEKVPEVKIKNDWRNLQ